MDDLALLRRYAMDGSDDAFGQLVEQRLSLVYATALRLSGGNAPLAQDAAQLVFTNLARRAAALCAKSSAAPPLSGWLHRDTYFTTLELLRQERRRRAREQEAATMNELDRLSSADEWELIRPLLDEALQKLEPLDRAALLLRFFERRSLAEVGECLGFGESGASRRISRALEKLRRLLARRGVTTPAAALSLILSTRAWEAAPAGLASRLAQASLAAAAAPSTLAPLAFMASTKLKMGALALAGLLLAGGAALQLRHSFNEASPGTKPSLPAPASPAASFPAGHPLAGRKPGSQQEAVTKALAAALARVRRALHEAGGAKTFPQQAMEEAIAGLGENAREAVPLLREALQETDPVVRLRAIAGLGLVGKDAVAAVPDLVAVMRRNGDPGFRLALSSLEQIGPPLEALPDVLQILRDQPERRLDLANSLDMFYNQDRGRIDAVAAQERALLNDPDQGVRQIAAYALAMALRGKAAPYIMDIAVESLQSADEDLRGLALSALKNVGTAASDPLGKVTLANLGPDAAKAMPALTEIVRNSTRADQKTLALQLLDALDPGLRQTDPVAGAALRQDEGMTLFLQKVGQGGASVPELIEGLQSYPKAGAAAARALAALGPGAQTALPALRAALGALVLQPDASIGETSQINQTRNALADALQKIDPDQPKALFTQTDIQSLLEILGHSAQAGDNVLKQRYYTALGSVVPPGSSLANLTPDQTDRLITAVAGIDPATGDAMLAQARKIDPHFVSQHAP